MPILFNSIYSGSIYEARCCNIKTMGGRVSFLGRDRPRLPNSSRFHKSSSLCPHPTVNFPRAASSWCKDGPKQCLIPAWRTASSSPHGTPLSQAPSVAEREEVTAPRAVGLQVPPCLGAKGAAGTRISPRRPASR